MDARVQIPLGVPIIAGADAVERVCAAPEVVTTARSPVIHAGFRPVLPVMNREV